MVKISKQITKIDKNDEKVESKQSKQINILGSIFKDSVQTDLKKEVVNELFDVEKNLEQKTELDKPIVWSCLQTFSQYVNDKEMKYSSGIIDTFINKTFRFFISKDRKGRDEYVQALKSLTHSDDEQIDDKKKISEMMSK